MGDKLPDFDTLYNEIVTTGGDGEHLEAQDIAKINQSLRTLAEAIMREKELNKQPLAKLEAIVTQIRYLLRPEGVGRTDLVVKALNKLHETIIPQLANVPDIAIYLNAIVSYKEFVMGDSFIFLARILYRLASMFQDDQSLHLAESGNSSGLLIFRKTGNEVRFNAQLSSESPDVTAALGGVSHSGSSSIPAQLIKISKALVDLFNKPDNTRQYRFISKDTNSSAHQSGQQES